MRDVLSRIRTRVDRLAAGWVCEGPHVLTTVSFVVLGGDPVPDGPPADAATCDRCGAELEYHRIIHVRDARVAE